MRQFIPVGRPIAALALAVVGATVGACAGGGPSSTTTAATIADADEDSPKSATTGDSGSSDTSDTEGMIDVDAFEPSSSTQDGSEGSSSSDDGDAGEVMACPSELADFATDPGWVAKNLPDGKNDYGWSAGTGHAGGAAGEVGGKFQRSLHRTSYGHVIAPKDGASCIYASGRIAIPRVDHDFRSRVSIGHFDGLGGAHVGFDIADDDGGNVRVSVMAGGLSEQAFVLAQPELVRTWTYVWDPALQTMTLTIDGVGTLVRPLDGGQAAAIVGLDRFGIRHDDHQNADNDPGVMTLYLDDIAYTR